MIHIDWDEYKIHKKMSIKEDNFEILLEFLKSYYNIVSAREIYDTLHNDDIAQMMLDKRSIKCVEELEDILYSV